MGGKVKVLLLFHQIRPYNDLRTALKKLAFPAVRAESFGQACKVLSQANPPLLVFTESELPDGNWSDVVSFSAHASSHVSVIVVGQEIDTRLYASAINVGALDFIAPPFDASDLAYVVRCAADTALARRQASMSSHPSV